MTNDEIQELHDNYNNVVCEFCTGIIENEECNICERPPFEVVVRDMVHDIKYHAKAVGDCEERDEEESLQYSDDHDYACYELRDFVKDPSLWYSECDMENALA